MILQTRQVCIKKSHKILIILTKLVIEHINQNILYTSKPPQSVTI